MRLQISFDVIGFEELAFLILRFVLALAFCDLAFLLRPSLLYQRSVKRSNLESDSNSLKWNMQTNFSNFQHGNEDCRHKGCDSAHHGGMNFEALLKDGNKNRIRFSLNYDQAAEVLSATINAWVLM